jgi:hypothetical protein
MAEDGEKIDAILMKIFFMALLTPLHLKCTMV